MTKAQLKHLLFCCSIPFLFLVSCWVSQPYATLEPGCSTPGEIASGEVQDAERGFPYRFGVFLPPCYNAEAKPGYPVIFMVPGRNGGPNDWFSAGITGIADQLILNNRIPPFIIVTTEGITGDPMVENIFVDLIPHIDAYYNTLSDRAHRAVGGGSLGGIAAYRLAFQHPDYFASSGMFGSGIINGEEDRVQGWLTAMNADNRVRVFLNTGEGDPLMLKQAEVMVSYLETTGVDYQFVVGEGDHSYAYWTTNMESYFLWVADDW